MSDNFKVMWGLSWVAISGAAWMMGYTGPGAVVIISALSTLWFIGTGLKGAPGDQ